MRTRDSAAVGLAVAVFAFFFILLIDPDFRAEGGSVVESVLYFLAVAVPGGLFCLWLATRGRR
ncbi:hypothetical protein [Streptomyces sp. S186]|uniref:hypothetical protein n=1 Tax=Streptomyces sp. S186 TaxID=3434395 RepID=UPI003F67D03B